MSIDLAKTKKRFIKKGDDFADIIEFFDTGLAKETRDVLKSNICSKEGFEKARAMNVKVAKSNPGLSKAIDKWIDDGEEHLTCDGG